MKIFACTVRLGRSLIRLGKGENKCTSVLIMMIVEMIFYVVCHANYSKIVAKMKNSAKT